MTALAPEAYLLASVLFVVGVMRMRHPATARMGNLIAAVGMAFALVVTIVPAIAARGLPLVAVVVVGALFGWVLSRKAAMTAMPQVVAFFNGVGGGAAALVALVEVAGAPGGGVPVDAAVSGGATILIGTVSFSGSIIAFLKLQGIMSGRPFLIPAHRALWAVLLAALFALVVVFAVVGGGWGVALPVVILAVIWGLLLATPVGGADMPVLISLLNSLTGLAAAATGFLLGNNVLVIAGALVGASGTILTQLMSRAMNRPLQHVLLGAFKVAATGVAAAADAEGTIRETEAEDVAMLVAHCRNVVIVPGFGLAVARAQQEVRELSDRLEARGVDVRFAIHPVAGRMPGHMNVLLAEADVPYDRLYDMDAINPEFPHTEVVLVVGANDVTNPSARLDPSSPLHGMPILNVDQAGTVIVLKRGQGKGFAGIENPLYTNPKTLMLYGDAKASLAKLLKALEDV